MHTIFYRCYYHLSHKAWKPCCDFNFANEKTRSQEACQRLLTLGKSIRYSIFYVAGKITKPSQIVKWFSYIFLYASVFVCTRVCVLMCVGVHCMCVCEYVCVVYVCITKVYQCLALSNIPDTLHSVEVIDH